MPAVVTAPERTAREDSGILDMLADWCTVALLRAPRDHLLTRAELHAHAPYLSDDTFERAVKRLEDHGLIAGCGQAAPPHRSNSCELTPAGVDVLGVADVVEGWEVEACRCERQHTEGAHAKLIAVPANREILRALSERGLTCTELERRLPGRTRSTLERRLGALRHAGLIHSRHMADQREVHHELTVHARKAGTVIVTVARWHWRWTPEQIPALAADVPGLICLIAPLVRMPVDMEGTCLLHVEHQPAAPAQAHVHLSVAEGRVTPLPLGSTRPPCARMHAEDAAWVEALCSGDPKGITVEGARALGHAVLAGLAWVVQ